MNYTSIRKEAMAKEAEQKEQSITKDYFDAMVDLGVDLI